MTWTYTFHRFTNRAAFDAAYDAAGFAREGGQIAPPETVALDVIGTLYDPAEYTPQGVMTKPPAALSGFHVNAAWSGGMPDAFKASLVVPTAPRRVFA
jgi:hypothetical protein